MTGNADAVEMWKAGIRMKFHHEHPFGEDAVEHRLGFEEPAGGVQRVWFAFSFVWKSQGQEQCMTVSVTFQHGPEVDAGAVDALKAMTRDRGLISETADLGIRVIPILRRVGVG